MIGMVLVTHGKLAAEFLAALEHVVGTPSNLAISVLDRANVEVIAGINLPMLIKLAGLREGHSLNSAVTAAQEAGRKYINVASQLLAARG
jgi:mannose PTS system EIIA component